MKVLLLGGTGAMGIHLVQLLKEKDVETFVTSRQNIKSDKNLHYLQGDTKDLFFLQKCLQLYRWDVIVDFMVYDTQTFKDRVDLLLYNTKQYVFLSSARVYANSKEPITEASPRLLDISQDTDYLKTDEYALTKARQEDILRNLEKKNWTIIRPYITYSEIRLQLGILEKEDWLYRALNGRTIVFSSDIMEKTTTLTYGFDVARGIAKIMDNSSALCQDFHITVNKSIQWSEVLCIYLSVLEKHLGYKPKVKLQNLDKFIEARDSKYQIFYDRLYNRVFDSSKIYQYLDSNSFSDTEIGLKKCLSLFLQYPRFNNINWREEAIKDRQVGERAQLNEILGIKSKIKYLIYRFGFKK